MGRLRATSIILAPLLAALALSACGGGSNAKLLPGTTASQINQNLEQVRQSVSEGNCESAEDASAAVTTQVGELGNGVDGKLKAALAQGAERLGEVVESCGEGEEAEELEEAAEQESLEEQEEEQATFEAEEQAEEKELKSQEKEEKTQQKEAEKEETGAAEKVPPGKAKGHEEEGQIEESEPPPPPVTPEGESGGIGPGGVAE